MNKQQLANKIWASANKMRSKIEANEYKDYILGFIFYKFLSEQEIRFTVEKGITEEELSQLKEEDADDVDFIQRNLGYFIAYKDLYSTWLNKRCDIKDVRDALSAFSRLIAPDYKKVFSGIFDTLQTGLNKLGTTDPERTKAVRDLLSLIKDIPMNDRQDYDVLGFIYEYLISQFAANAGKKAGEFYTPHEVSLLMSEIVAYHLKDREHIEIYDPTSGSGSLLINIGKSVARHIQKDDSIKYYAQELKENTFNLTRMNLVMRGIKPANIVARNGDTLKEDWPYFEDTDPEGTYNLLPVDAVVSNPPYSQAWTPPRKSKNDTTGEHDPRFEYGIAPKGKADFAFLLHDLYHLKSDGIMTIVLPHGVLFRGDAGDGTPDNPGDDSEGSIRRQLIENNHIDTIIGLPADIFFGTGIPTIVMVLRKHRDRNDVLFIDASKGFKKEGKKNKLRASDIKRIVDTYISRSTTPRYSRLVEKDEIRRNGYNLNIPRYVNSSADPETWDMYATMYGGLPKAELDKLNDYWAALPSLFDSLFEKNDTPYTQLKVEDVASAIKQHTSVKNFIDRYNAAFDDFGQLLKTRLIDNMFSLSITAEETEITELIFSRLQDIPLIDRFEAYQLFVDKWTSVAQDIETLQQEGFEATRVVDPNMVVKKKDDKEFEVQDGWVGRILPFELVQKTHLHEQWQSLQDKCDRLELLNSEAEAAISDLSEEEKETVTNDDGTFSPKLLKQQVAHFRKMGVHDKDSVEVRLMDIQKLLDEQKSLKSAIKADSLILEKRTKEVIENELTDEDVRSLLVKKWIEPLLGNLNQLPRIVIDAFIEKVISLKRKYETTLVDVEKDIHATSLQLSEMIDDLRGDEYDMKALGEFKKLLQNI